MSINLLLENDAEPVVWRGPVIAGTVKQFWTDVIWEEIDYMLVDMPPGTGDVPLTVFQSIPVDGIIIVASPQELVSMIVAKAVNMAKMMDIPILGIVENMSYVECPDCGKKINVFGREPYRLGRKGTRPRSPGQTADKTRIRQGGGYGSGRTHRAGIYRRRMQKDRDAVTDTRHR